MILWYIFVSSLSIAKSRIFSRKKSCCHPASCRQQQDRPVPSIVVPAVPSGNKPVVSFPTAPAPPQSPSASPPTGSAGSFRLRSGRSAHGFPRRPGPAPRACSGRCRGCRIRHASWRTPAEWTAHCG